jgi:succinate dehydrogenase/fumarate reductase flavoprotein subunit
MKSKERTKWPFPVLYGKEKEFSSDVLVLGGGISACWAAIHAARNGASVTLVDKGCVIRSGCGGPGCDHWAWAADNPACKLSPEELSTCMIEARSNWTNGISSYINCATGYKTLMELEKMGAQVRDIDDKFVGAPFRDDKTKLMYAFDYENRTTMRVWGPTFKPSLLAELKRLGVNLVERCQATNLLTEGGRQGARVVGATGVNNRTGEFVIFKARATILAMGIPARNWVFSTEWRGLSSFKPVVLAGNGHAMAWRAGAELTLMERSMALPFDNAYSYSPYSDGNCYNTWYPCSLADADGKQIPWVDRDGKIIENVDDRSLPSKAGQKMYLGVPGLGRAAAYEYALPGLIPDLRERILKGEYKLPLYADLPSMPDYERRVIWGVMIGSESKTKIPILMTYGAAGFDPEKDMLQSYYMLGGSSMMREPSSPRERMIFSGGGGLVVDWTLKSSLEGLFGAGENVFGTNGHAGAATTGRHAGICAAHYVKSTPEPVVDRAQIDREKKRVYAPTHLDDGVDWKEMNMGLCRIMQNYVSEPKTEGLMNMGLNALKEYEEEEVPQLFADNPHKLGRTIDVMDVLTVDQVITHACLARKASSNYLNFNRLDYPEKDPQEWKKWITLKLEDGEVKKGELPSAYWGPLKESYEKALPKK